LRNAYAEQVGEQMVIAPPAAHLVKRHYKQIGPIECLKPRLPPSQRGVP
jgi:hypothetical protein